MSDISANNIVGSGNLNITGTGQINSNLTCNTTIATNALTSNTIVSGTTTSTNLISNSLSASTPSANIHLFTNSTNNIDLGNNGYGISCYSSQILLPTGNISLTLAPYISAYLNSGSTIALNSGVYAKCIFDGIEFQTNSAYSITTGLFTVPSAWAGLYSISANLNIQSSSTANNTFVVIYKNNVYYRKFIQFGSATSSLGAIGNIILNLSVGDTISLYAYSASITGGSIYSGGSAKDTWLTICYLRS
jgi:hypothetical protein